VRLKDISQAQLDLGIDESRRVLEGQVKKGRLTAEKAAAVLEALGTATLAKEAA
jgi:3-hydroxyacyl-CoA dehydrogenase